MNKFGVVQGRLTPAPKGELQYFPHGEWQKEFESASKLDFSFIELIVEREHNSMNPFWSLEGRQEIKTVASKNDLEVYSACTDFIINHGMLGSEKARVQRHICEFLNAASEVGCRVVVLPLLEESSITKENYKEYLSPLRDIGIIAEEVGISIAIETLLPGATLLELLESLKSPSIGCVFDTGNRVVDNINLDLEIKELGHWITHVHIKDKTSQGENVLLSTGLVDFSKVFCALHKLNYTGPFVFETTRGLDPLNTAKFHKAFCDFFWSESSV